MLTNLSHSEAIGMAKGLPYLVRLSLTRVQIFTPSELKLETGRLVALLGENLQGMDKDELLRAFYSDFATSSFLRRNCLTGALNKVIQRARKRFEKYGLHILFCQERKKWFLVPVECLEVYKSAKSTPPMGKEFSAQLCQGSDWKEGTENKRRYPWYEPS